MLAPVQVSQLEYTLCRVIVQCRGRSSTIQGLGEEVGFPLENKSGPVSGLPGSLDKPLGKQKNAYY